MSTANYLLSQKESKSRFSTKGFSIIAILFGWLFFAFTATAAFAGGTSQWIWMGGGPNTPLPGDYSQPGIAGGAPGARVMPSTWTDPSGNLWLFGGFGYDANGMRGDLNDLWMYSPISMQWTWMAGFSAFPQTTTDGVGMALTGASPGGREGAAAWTDKSGNLWLFGGKGWDSGGNYGELNDLWEYTGGSWSLIGGEVALPCNGYESSAPWTGCGETSAISTYGTPDPGNWPGGRQNATAWTDSGGNLWLFGGGGFGQNNGPCPAYPDTAAQNAICGELNTLWVYVPGSGWAIATITGSGTDIVNEPTQYSGYPAYIYGPGGRDLTTNWVDQGGNLWLFGGEGIDASGTGNYGLENDLWQFQLMSSYVSNLSSTVCCNYYWWEPEGGSLLSDAPASGVPTSALPGQYGMPGVGTSTNQPGRRMGSAGWTDSSGNLWLFGGWGYDSQGTQGALSDLWEYSFGWTCANPSCTALNPNNLWNWAGGSNLANQVGTYAAVVGNTPGGRNSFGSWVDKDGNFWIFGGHGMVNTSTGPAASILNELWVFEPSAMQAATPVISPATGNYGAEVLTVTITDTTPNATIYYTTDGSDPTTSSTATPYSGSFRASYSETVKAVAVANPLYTPSTVATTTYAIQLTAPPVISPGSGIYTSPLTVTITDATPGAAIYYTTDGSAPTPSPSLYSQTTSPYAGSFQLSSSAQVCAIAVNPGYGWGQSQCVYLLINNQAAPPFFYPPAGSYAAANVTIDDTSPGVTIYYTLDGTTPTTSSPVYGAPIPITATKTIQAIASGGPWNTGSGLSGANLFSPSSVGSATYSLSPAAVQSALWTWMGGSSQMSSAIFSPWGDEGAPGSYGAPGVAAKNNTPSGREESVQWTDSTGNLWLFGGVGFDSSGKYGLLNDLWEYNIASGYWAWMGGSNTTVGVDATYGVNGPPGVYTSAIAANNVPGGRAGAVSWTDSKGNFWLFGGQGNDANGTLGYLNDLWEYVQASATWVWMGGSSTVPGYETGQPGNYGPMKPFTPGGRIQAQSWTDPQGNLWLFGGMGADANGTMGYLNDLWEYVPGSGWAWMGGAPQLGGSWQAAPGNFGTQGVVNSNNVPSGRMNTVGWADVSGNLWLFGGGGADANGYVGWLNDLWEYTPSSKNWVWVSGNAALPTPYFSMEQTSTSSGAGVFASNNTPSASVRATAWTDKAGNLWLFGGGGWNIPNLYGDIVTDLASNYNVGSNSLWEFNTSSREWAWIGGPPPTVTPYAPNAYWGFFEMGAGGIYGTQGVPAAGNAPGSRNESVSWTDKAGNFWLFGGYGEDAIVNQGGLGTPSVNWGFLNDLWKFQPGTISAPLTPTTTTLVSSLNPSVYGQLVPLTATVTSAAGAPPNDANVTFSYATATGTTTLCTVTLNAGSAQCPVATLPAGVYSITATYNGDASFASSVSSALSQTVGQATLTITASSASVNYGDSVPTILPIYSGWMNGDSSSSLTTPPTCGTAYTTTSDPGTPSTSCSGAADSNYTFNYVDGTVTVSKATPIVTTWPTASPITYGQTLLSSSLTGWVASVAGGFAWTIPSTAPDAGTPPESVTFTPSDSTDYNTVIGSIPLTVNKAPQTIAFTDGLASVVDYVFVFGKTNNFNISASGGASGNPVTLTANGFGSLSSYVSLAGSASALLTITNGGDIVTVTANQDGNSNYLPATAVAQTFKLLILNPPQLQFIKFAALPSSVTYGVGPIPLSATATSGLAVTFSVLSGPGYTSGSNLIVTGAGTVVVAANQAGNSSYAAAQATQQVVVNPAMLIVTANNATRFVGAANPTFTPSYSGFVNGDSAAVLSGSPKLTTTATTSSPAGNYTITASQGTLAAANYSFTLVNGTLSVLAPPTVVIATSVASLTMVPGGYQVTVVITNNGTAPANNVQLTSASLGSATPSNTPQWNGNLGTLAAGASTKVTVSFPASAGQSGAGVSEKFAGVYTGGTLNSVTYPGGTFAFSIKSTVLP